MLELPTADLGLACSGRPLLPEAGVVKLKPGTRLAIEIEPHGRGFKVVPRARVGSAAKALGSPKVCKSMFEAYVEIEKWAQEQQAREGLRATSGIGGGSSLS